MIENYFVIKTSECIMGSCKITKIFLYLFFLQVCGSKDEPDTQLFCEECQYVTHMRCLDPPLEEKPEGDFYCPYCK